MTTLRVHFDGRVLVPEEPVNLPIGESLEIAFKQAAAEPIVREYPIVVRNGIPVFQLPPDAATVTSDDVKRFQDGDEF